MPKKFDIQSSFRLTSLDKAIMEQCLNNPLKQLSIWMQGYFDGIVLPYQEYFYSAPQPNKLLVAGIRTGKSELVSMGFLHFAQFHPGSVLLNTSISSEQAKIVYYNCMKYCQASRFRHWIKDIQSSPYPTIKFENGSELWFRSLGYEAELLRGFEFDLINVDEAGYVTHPNTISTLRGRLLGINPLTHKHRAGLFWQVSSPKGRGLLFEEWKKGDPQYDEADTRKHLSLRATTFDNPLLNQDLLMSTLESLSESMRLQELYGIFLEDTDVLFPYQLVMNGCDPNDRHVRWLYDQIRFFNTSHSSSKKKLYSDLNNLSLPAGHLEKISQDLEHYECEPVAGHNYINSWDQGKKATSSGRNATVGMVFDVTHEPWQMVAYLYDEGMGYVESKAKFEEWHQKYSLNGNAYCSTIFDATGKGDVVKEYVDMEQNIKDVTGMVYSGSNKPYLLQAGKIAIERGLVRYPFIKKMVDQLSQYIPDDKKIPQDIVMAFCQAMYHAREKTRLSGEAPQSRHRTGTDVAHVRDERVRRNARFIESRRSRRAGRAGEQGTRTRRAS